MCALFPWTKAAFLSLTIQIEQISTSFSDSLLECTVFFTRSGGASRICWSLSDKFRSPFASSLLDSWEQEKNPLRFDFGSFVDSWDEEKKLWLNEYFAFSVSGVEMGSTSSLESSNEWGLCLISRLTFSDCGLDFLDLGRLGSQFLRI